MKTTPIPLKYRIAAVLAAVSTVALGVASCGGGDSVASSSSNTDANNSSGVVTLPISSGSSTSSTSSTTTAGVLCDYASSVFNTSASVNATATATWSCTATQRKLVANGLPDHAVGTFPNANNPNAISAQSISVLRPLVPSLKTTVTGTSGPSLTIGHALNGIKIDPATAGTCDNSGTSCSLTSNTGAWNIEALGQTTFKFGTDTNNAHVQPGGAYHYHGIPEGFVTRLNKGQAMTLIGWAADGFPIYARYGYTTATDAKSAIKLITPSYKIKAKADTNRPSTTTYPMGTFSQDYEYVAGSGDLDECNGRTGVTPEFPKGIYHYYATDNYPYLQRCLKGAL